MPFWVLVLLFLCLWGSPHPSSAQCGGLITQTTGRISSPNYPNEYPNHSNCSWEIRVPEGHYIHLTFLAFNLEEATFCGYDSVTIYDGISHEIAKLCRPGNNPFYSSSNIMKVSFKSDGSDRRSGFLATFSAIYGVNWRLVDGQNCMEQPQVTEALAGESVTIPCSFIYTEDTSNVKSIIFLLKAKDELYCGDVYDNVIYNSSNTPMVTSPQYEGRLTVSVDKKHRNASITIDNVTPRDSTRYCCRVLITYRSGSGERWQNKEGTRLQVRDTPGLKLYPDIFAMAEDNVTIIGPKLQTIGRTNTLNIFQPEEIQFTYIAILSCSFSLQQENNVLNKEVYWMIGNPRSDFVYHPDEDYIHPDYRGKTSLVNGSNLLLTEFSGQNNTIFYCRVMLRRCEGNGNIIDTVLEEGPGTRLQMPVTDKPSLKVRHDVFALVGDNVTILSRFTQTSINSSINITNCRVGLSKESVCDPFTDIGSCGFEENILSVNITQVAIADGGRYCWKVGMSTSNGRHNQYIYLGPKLQIIGRTNTLNISQPEEIQFSDSAIISCSFNLQPEHNILQKEVYWIIRNPRVDFVYHSDEDFIHPDYRGKTSLVNGSHLLLKEFPGQNNTVFFCQVMLRRYVGNRNNRVTFLEEGPGTRLLMPEVRPSNSVLVIALSVGSVGLILFLCLLFGLRRVKGQKKPEITEKEEDENMVYANTEETTFSANKMAKKPRDSGSELTHDEDQNVMYGNIYQPTSSTKIMANKSRESGSEFDHDGDQNPVYDNIDQPTSSDNTIPKKSREDGSELTHAGQDEDQIYANAEQIAATKNQRHHTAQREPLPRSKNEFSVMRL